MEESKANDAVQRLAFTFKRPESNGALCGINPCQLQRGVEKKGEKRENGTVMRKEIHFSPCMQQLCWLSVDYSNQLEQKGLKRTLVFEKLV